MQKNPKVDLYIEKKTSEWSLPLVTELRRIYLKAGLTEEVKWGAPTYSHHGLVCNIGVFKNHVASWYFQGALLSDPSKQLVQAQKTTKALRGLRFSETSPVNEEMVTQMVLEAMVLNEKGIKVDLKKDRKLEVPDYFLSVLGSHPVALNHFNKFSYSRKKEYVDWITEAKRADTRERRIVKSIEMLKEGKGRNDKYR